MEELISAGPLCPVSTTSFVEITSVGRRVSPACGAVHCRSAVFVLRQRREDRCDPVRRSHQRSPQAEL